MFLPQVTHLITHSNFHLPSSQVGLQANIENYENNSLKLQRLILKQEISFQRLSKIFGVESNCVIQCQEKCLMLHFLFTKSAVAGAALSNPFK